MRERERAVRAIRVQSEESMNIYPYFDAKAKNHFVKCSMKMPIRIVGLMKDAMKEKYHNSQTVHIVQYKMKHIML